MFELGVRAIIKDLKGRVLFVRNDHGIHKGKLVVPGGRVEFKELAIEAIKREVKEETGLDFEPEFLTYTEDLTSRNDTHFIALVFTGKASGILKTQDSLEILEIKYLTLGEIKESDEIIKRYKDIILKTVE
jgi:8-oxo-dGTP diphosphatase